MTHGQLVNYRGRLLRWCMYHEMYHGRLYECESYPDEIKLEIQHKDSMHRAGMTATIVIMVLLTIIAMLI